MTAIRFGGFLLVALGAGAAAAQPAPGRPVPEPAAPVPAPPSADPGEPPGPPAAVEPDAPAVTLEDEGASPPAPPQLPPPLAPAPVMMPPPYAHGPLPAGAPVPADAGPPEPPDDGRMGTHQSHWMGVLGVRTAFIGGPGFDPFADDDVLVQSSVGVGRTVIAVNDWSLFAAGLWDFGAREDSIRDQQTTLSVHRVAVGPEVRYHAARRLFAFGRVVPALLNAQAILADDATGASLEAHEWVFGLDASAGLALEVIGQATGASRQPRFWLIAEGGYGWSVPVDLALEPEGGGAPARLAALDLGELAVRGGMFRVAAALSF